MNKDAEDKVATELGEMTRGVIVTEDQFWRSLRPQRGTGAGPDGLTGREMTLLLKTCVGYPDRRPFVENCLNESNVASAFMRELTSLI